MMGWRFGIVFGGLALVGLAACAVRAEPTVEFTKSPGKMLVKINGQAMATYVYDDAEIPRPYFSGVCAPGGIQVTRNQPPIEGKAPTDHPKYHPGLWLAFGDLGGGDFWRNRDRVLHEAFIEQPDGGAGEGTFAVRNRYERVNGTVVCRELCRYKFMVRPSGYLLMWDSTFSADKEFFFGDQEEMGLGIRMASPITVKAGGSILDSHGRMNESQIWSKTAEWCDYSGVVNGQHARLDLL